MKKVLMTQDEISEDENLFFHENLPYFDDNNKLITIEDDSKFTYQAFGFFGIVFLILGLLISSQDIVFSILFSLVSCIPLGIALFLYISNKKYKKTPLILYKKSLKVGEVLRGYVTISLPMESKNFKIVLENLYHYEKKTRSGNSTKTKWDRHTIYSYKTKGYVEVKNNITYIYFQIPVKEGIQKIETISNTFGTTTKEYYWKLRISTDKKFSLFQRNYKIKIKNKKGNS